MKRYNNGEIITKNRMEDEEWYGRYYQPFLTFATGDASTNVDELYEGAIKFFDDMFEESVSDEVKEKLLRWSVLHVERMSAQTFGQTYRDEVSNGQEHQDDVSPEQYNRTKIDDLSYSGIVKLIQGNQYKGGDLLNSIALEVEETEKKIENIEKELSVVKSNKRSLFEACSCVLNHLKKEMPAYIQRDGYVIVIAKNCVKIERNVI